MHPERTPEQSLLRGEAVLADPEAQYFEAAAQNLVHAVAPGRHAIDGLKDTFTDRDAALRAARLMVRARHVRPGEPISAAEAAYFESVARGAVEARGVADYGVTGLRTEFPDRPQAVDAARALLRTQHAPEVAAPDC